MRRLQALVVGLVLAVATAASSAQMALYELTVDGESLGVVDIYQSPQGLLLERSLLQDLKRIHASALALLPAVEYEFCRDCVRLAEVGAYELNQAEVSMDVSLSQTLLKPITLFGSGQVKEPLTPSGGFAFTTSYSVLAREAKTATGERISRQSYLLQPRLGLGPLGVLQSGWRNTISEVNGFREQESHLLDSKLTRYFWRTAIQAQLGEVRSLQIYNQPGISILGFRFARDFSIRPDFSHSPNFSFYGDVERPSTVRLFVNGQQRRQQEIDRPGEVRLSDYRPNASGRVVVVVTDVNGSEKVVELDLYQDSDLLNPGQLDFALSAGRLNNSQQALKNTDVVDGYLRLGLNHWATLGLSATWAAYNADADTLQTNPEYGTDYGQARLGLTARNRLLGKFEFSVARQSSDFGEADSYRAFWSNAKALPNNWLLSMGALYIHEPEARSLTLEATPAEGYRAYVGLGRGIWQFGANAFDFETVTGFGVTAQLSLGSLRLSASASRSDQSTDLYLLRLKYRFGKSAQLGYSGRFVGDRSKEEHSLEFANALADGRVRLGGTIGNRAYLDNGEVIREERYQASATADAGPLMLSLNHSQQLAETNTNAMLRGGLAVDRYGNMAFSSSISERKALLTVISNKPNIPVKINSQRYNTGSGGSVMSLVRGFGNTRVETNVSTLPLGSVIENERQRVAVYPGLGAVVKLQVSGVDVSIQFPGLAANTILVSNGIEYFYDGKFLPFKDVLPGCLYFRAAGRRFVVNAPDSLEFGQMLVAEEQG